MVLYKCFRCGYIASQRINLRHHLNRKNICNPLEDDMEIDEIKKYYGFKIDIQIAEKQHLNCTQNAPKCTFWPENIHPKYTFLHPK